MTEQANDYDCRVVLTETTVADVGEVRVGLSNVWDDDHTDPNGNRKQEVRATLSLMFDDSEEDFDVRVAEGDEVVIADIRYRVTKVHEGETLGSVTLDRVELGPTQAVPNEGSVPSSRDRAIDLASWIVLLLLPYLSSSLSPRAWIAAVAIPVWVILARPAWRGLSGFYSTGILVIHALILSAVALWH